jgi:hypothetical protein
LIFKGDIVKNAVVPTVSSSVLCGALHKADYLSFTVNGMIDRAVSATTHRDAPQSGCL